MIRFENVYKSLGGRPVLRGLSLEIRRGETMVIVGGSGTGKSVSLKHMVGLLRADAGKVWVADQDVGATGGRDLEALRRRFGVLFQSGALLNWMTVEENVALPLYEHSDLGDDQIRARTRERLALVHLEGSEAKYPSEISGGMKKRVALARALILEPEILLYDEPTAGLDPVMSRHVDKLIMETQQQLRVTSVVVTHDLHSAFAIADRIAMLHEGRAIEVSAPAEFVKSPHPFVREFIKAQFESGTVEVKA
jgi:phospholipid/cholesterol/gamma-HCH transport system ATP-binding protein